MSFRRDTRDEVSGGGALQDASRGLLRMAGGWGNISGPGIFMVRTVFSGTVSAVCVGVVGASCTAVVYGTAALPFLVCACAGFAFGAIGFYRDAVRQSLISLERYPRLLRTHLDENFPWRGFDRFPRDQLRRRVFEQSWQMRSMLVVAWLTAQPAIDQINENKEQALIKHIRDGTEDQSLDLETIESGKP